MGNNITVYDLQKIMLTAFQDANVTGAFLELIYDYFNNTSGIAKTSLNDQTTTKYIDVVTKKKTDYLKATSAIKEIYGTFVLSVLNEKSLEYLLSRNNPDYYRVKACRDSDIFNIAVGLVTVMNLSNDDNTILRIYMVN